MHKLLCLKLLFVFNSILVLGLVFFQLRSYVLYIYAFLGMKLLLTYGWSWSIVWVGIYSLYYGRYLVFHYMCFGMGDHTYCYFLFGADYEDEFQDIQLPEDSVNELACDLVRALQYVVFPLFTS